MGEDSKITIAEDESAASSSCTMKYRGDRTVEADSVAMAEWMDRTFAFDADVRASLAYSDKERNATVANTAKTAMTTMSSARVKPVPIRFP